jgi:hypothetical protein
MDKVFDHKIMIKKTQIKDQRSQYFYILKNKNEEIKELGIINSNKVTELLQIPLTEEEEKEHYFANLLFREMAEEEIEKNKGKLYLDSEMFPPKRRRRRSKWGL